MTVTNHTQTASARKHPSTPLSMVPTPKKTQPLFVLRKDAPIEEVKTQQISLAEQSKSLLLHMQEIMPPAPAVETMLDNLIDINRQQIQLAEFLDTVV